MKGQRLQPTGNQDSLSSISDDDFVLATQTEMFLKQYDENPDESQVPTQEADHPSEASYGKRKRGAPEDGIGPDSKRIKHLDSIDGGGSSSKTLVGEGATGPFPIAGEDVHMKTSYAHSAYPSQSNAFQTPTKNGGRGDRKLVPPATPRSNRSARLLKEIERGSPEPRPSRWPFPSTGEHIHAKNSYPNFAVQSNIPQTPNKTSGRGNVSPASSSTTRSHRSARILGEIERGSLALRPASPPSPSRRVVSSSKIGGVFSPPPNAKPVSPTLFPATSKHSASYLRRLKVITEAVAKQDELEMKVQSAPSSPTQPRVLPSAAGLSSAPPSPPAKGTPKLHNAPEEQPPMQSQTGEWYFRIAHSKKAQMHMDKLKISWSVQWELARGVSCGWWDWSDVTNHRLCQLRGANPSTYARIGQVMKYVSWKSTKEMIDMWAEMNREQLAIMENKGRGLGLMGAWEGVPDWHGGNVQQVLILTKTANVFSFKLQCPEKRGRSHLNGRYLGSRRILQIRIGKDLTDGNAKEVQTFLASHRFVLCGRVYLAFSARVEGAYLVEVCDDNYERTPLKSEGDDLRISFMDFIGWQNPIAFNSKQTANKWAARFYLNLSTSVPVLEFDAKNILECNDIFAEDCTEAQRHLPEKNMTDGMGYINATAQKCIAEVLGLDYLPSAIQGRVFGAKGVWILDPKDRDLSNPPRIWIAPSQRKVRYSPLKDCVEDRAHRIFNFITASGPTSTSKLSKEFIMIMSANGVPDTVFLKLFRDGLNVDVGRLAAWTQSDKYSIDDMTFLWDAVHDAGKLASARVRRSIGARARALGFGRNMDEERAPEILEGRDGLNPVTGPDEEPLWSDYEESDDAGEGESELKDMKGDCSFPGREDYSGQPVSVHEKVVVMLQSGFTPAESPYLFDELKAVVKHTIDDYVSRLHIPIPCSSTAFIVADPYGCLKEGEIFFRSSRPFVDPMTGLSTDILKGPVLMGRHPTALPHDIRKVTAVLKEELMEYVDVIVVSVKGNRSAANWLGGGDYDGDTALVIWQPELTAAFTNSAFFSEGDGFQMQNFDRTSINLQGLHKNEARMRPILLQGLQRGYVGQYSRKWFKSFYANGATHRKTIRCGYMYAYCLDAQKSGLQVKQDVLSQDDKEWGPFSLPPCLNPRNKKPGPTSGAYLKRDAKQGRFVLDELVALGEKESDRHLREFEKYAPKPIHPADEDLLRPYIKARELAESWRDNRSSLAMMEDLDILCEHVTGIFAEWQKEMRTLAKGKDKSATIKNTSMSRFPAIRPLVERFCTQPSGGISLLDASAEIRASYAYKIAVADQRFKKKPLFVADMAFQRMCAIKANSCSSFTGGAPMTREFNDRMAISKATMKVTILLVCCHTTDTLLWSARVLYASPTKYTYLNRPLHDFDHCGTVEPLITDSLWWKP